MRESSSGFHFMNLYQNCPWKFYIRYVKGIYPRFVSPFLSFGVAIHGAVAAYLLGRDHQEEFRRLMHEARKDYQNEEDYILDSNRGLVLLATWVAEVGEGIRSDYHILEAEAELKVPLPNGYIVTARPDACLVPKSKHGSPRPPVYILETKTTRWGRQLVEETLQNADQITTYLWATGKAHKDWNIQGVIPNVMYQNKSKIGVGLGDLIFRTSADLTAYEAQLTGLLVEISQKVLALEKGFHPNMLFPRNTSWCGSYNHPCEYINICRNVNLDVVPEGFKREEVIDEKTLAPCADPGSAPTERPGDEASQRTFDFGNGF